MESKLKIEPMEEEKKPPAIEKKQQKLQKKRAVAENSNLLVDKKDLNAAIKKQIEFYFSDSNLYHDAFLYNLLQQSGKKQEIDSSVITKFSRMKELLANLPEESNQLEFIKSALSGSSIVTLSEDLKVFKRKQPFNREEYQKKSQVDKRTIYVENLPSAITHECLAAIFAKVGKIQHISLPKFTQSKKPKGFAFIEFDTIENAVEAIKKLNGVVPAEFMDPENGHYVPSEGSVQALRVMSVVEWLSYKKEFKAIMKEIEQLNGTAGQDVEGGKTSGSGCLVQLEGLPENTTKANIRIFVAHFAKPEYVDYKRGNSYAVIRFGTAQDADKFIEGCKDKEKVRTLGKMDVKPVKLNKEEEADYLLLAEKHKKEFKEYCAAKKKKKKFDEQ